MAYIKKQGSAIFSKPTPPTATLALHEDIVDRKIKFFKDIFDKKELITESKHIYSLVINSVDKDGNRMEDLLGTDNAKDATSQIMFALLTGAKHTL